MRPIRAVAVAIFVVSMTASLWPVAANAQEADLANMNAAQVYAEAGRHAVAGDHVGAIKIYEYLVEQFPDDQRYTPSALYRICGAEYQANRFKESEAAGLRVFKDYPESDCARNGQPTFYLTGIYLYRQDNPQAVLDMVKTHCDKYAPNLHSYEWSTCLLRVALAHLKKGDAAAARDFLEARLPQCINLITNPEYYETVVQIAMEQKDNATALAAARNGYAFCDFDEATIKRMAELVRKTLMATGDFSKGLQFLAAQDDPTAPNPLKEIGGPKVTDQQRDEMLTAVGNKPATRSLVYLYCGEYDKALSDAILYIAQATQTEAVKSIMSVARVFKAADLSVHRANRFIEFARTGKGENPCTNPGF